MMEDGVLVLMHCRKIKRKKATLVVGITSSLQQWESVISGNTFHERYSIKHMQRKVLGEIRKKRCWDHGFSLSGRFSLQATEKMGSKMDFSQTTTSLISILTAGLDPEGLY